MPWPAIGAWTTRFGAAVRAAKEREAPISAASAMNRTPRGRKPATPVPSSEPGKRPGEMATAPRRPNPDPLETYAIAAPTLAPAIPMRPGSTSGRRRSHPTAARTSRGMELV